MRSRGNQAKNRQTFFLFPLVPVCPPRPPPTSLAEGPWASLFLSAAVVAEASTLNRPSLSASLCNALRNLLPLPPPCSSAHRIHVTFVAQKGRFEGPDLCVSLREQCYNVFTQYYPYLTFVDVHFHSFHGSPRQRVKAVIAF